MSTPNSREEAQKTIHLLPSTLDEVDSFALPLENHNTQRISEAYEHPAVSLPVGPGDIDIHTNCIGNALIYPGRKSVCSQSGFVI